MNQTSNGHSQKSEKKRQKELPSLKFLLFFCTRPSEERFFQDAVCFFVRVHGSLVYTSWESRLIIEFGSTIDICPALDLKTSNLEKLANILKFTLRCGFGIENGLFLQAWPEWLALSPPRRDHGRNAGGRVPKMCRVVRRAWQASWYSLSDESG